MTMGDRIVVMKDGLIQQVDTRKNLYDYPCNIFVAGFIGFPQMNFLDGTLKKTGDQFTVDLAGSDIPLPKEKTADGKLDAYVGKTLKVGIRLRTSRTTRNSSRSIPTATSPLRSKSPG